MKGDANAGIRLRRITITDARADCGILGGHVSVKIRGLANETSLLGHTSLRPLQSQ